MRGFRHDAGCLCGCQLIAGMPGGLVVDVDHAKLLDLGLAVYRFPKAYARGTLDVAYVLDEIPVEH